MERAHLEASLRTVIGGRAVKRLRNQGLVPAVAYGQNIDGGKVEIQVPLITLKKLLSAHPGNALLDLKLADRGGLSVVIKEIQRDAISRDPIHVDFKQVNLDVRMTANVAIHLVGNAKGVKEGGILEHTSREVSVSCLPTDMPEVIEVNVAGLGLGEKITAGQITLPANVTLAGDPDQVVVTIAEVVEKEAGEESAAEPEVIREKKAEPKA